MQCGACGERFRLAAGTETAAELERLIYDAECVGCGACHALTLANPGVGQWTQPPRKR